MQDVYLLCLVLGALVLVVQIALDLFGAGLENPDDLFVVRDEPLGLVEVTVERD